MYFLRNYTDYEVHTFYNLPGTVGLSPLGLNSWSMALITDLV